jgi:protein TonB
MFEQNRSREAETLGGSRSRLFPVSLAIHGAGLLAVLGASLWTVEDPPDPPVPITWVSTVPPPPGGAETARPPAGTRTARGAVVSPASIPDRLPIAASLSDAAEEVEPGSGASGALSDVDGDGDGEGVLDGVEGGTERERSDPGSGERILRPGGDVYAPVLVSRVEPVYPEGARKARLEGVVVVEAIITSRGEVEEVHVVKSGGLFLDASAKEAVERWKYRPATLNGRAVRVLLTVTIRFRLH